MRQFRVQKKDGRTEPFSMTKALASVRRAFAFSGEPISAGKMKDMYKDLRMLCIRDSDKKQPGIALIHSCQIDAVISYNLARGLCNKTSTLYRNAQIEKIEKEKVLSLIHQKMLDNEPVDFDDDWKMVMDVNLFFLRRQLRRMFQLKKERPSIDKDLNAAYIDIPGISDTHGYKTDMITVGLHLPLVIEKINATDNVEETEKKISGFSQHLVERAVLYIMALDKLRTFTQGESECKYEIILGDISKMPDSFKQYALNKREELKMSKNVIDLALYGA